jgi:tRNA 2-thiouridine synthesizing protein E
MAIEINGVVIATDDQGYLVDPETWNDAVAEKLAQQAGIILSDEHKKILQFIRNYYDQHRLAADARFVMKYLEDELGYKDNASQRLYQLFPYGYMQQVCKIAGMRRPRAWSTG